MTATAPLMLSVSGLRGLIGQSLTPPVAARYAAAFGGWLHRNAARPDNPPHVVLGRDSRPSGAMIEHAAVAGLLAAGCRVTTLGIVTTPTVALMAEHLHADGGMVITASHNPIIWNGIKALRHDGVAPPADQAQQIIDAFKQDRIEYVSVDRLQPTAHDATGNDVHVRRVLDHIDVQAVRKRKPRVVLDSVCGAGGPAAAMLLRELGAQVVHLHAQPTGLFPHTPEPTRENLTELCDAVRTHGADIGFAQDPDADRLAIVDEKGRYIGEEYTLVLTVLRLLERHGKPGAKLAANLSTSRMIDDVAAQFGATVARTPVGEANVVQAMRSSGALAGGEGNGGIIWPKVVHVRDSLSGIALALELLATGEGTLSQRVARVPAYAIVKDKVDMDNALAQRLRPALRQRYASQKIDEQDGIRIDWPDQWVHVRPSNTEPIIRLIAEARDESAARALLAEVRATLGL